MTNTPTLYTRIPYRGYTMMIDRDGKTQIWSGQDCICTESTPNDARKIIDHWVDGASR